MRCDQFYNPSGCNSVWSKCFEFIGSNRVRQHKAKSKIGSRRKQEKDIPILAIRAVQAGALTSKMDREPHPSGFDHPDFADYEKAQPFRELAEDWGESPASLAHRYALSIDKVGSVILGIKNREELIECLEAEKKVDLIQSKFTL